MPIASHYAGEDPTIECKIASRNRSMGGDRHAG
jgi:hypothetical protein